MDWISLYQNSCSAIFLPFFQAGLCGRCPPSPKVHAPHRLSQRLQWLALAHSPLICIFSTAQRFVSFSGDLLILAFIGIALMCVCACMSVSLCVFAVNTTGGIISKGPKIEGQAIFKRGGKFYLIGSHLTGKAYLQVDLHVASAYCVFVVRELVGWWVSGLVDWWVCKCVHRCAQ